MLKITNNGRELEQRAKETLLSILKDFSGLTVLTNGDSETDLILNLKTSAGVQTLICEVKSRAYPNELHAAFHSLKQFTKGHGKRAHPVFIAPSLSKQAQELCAEQGVSWVDLAGNCELKFPGCYIKIQGNQNPESKTRRTNSLYTPKASRVVHALLTAYGHNWTTEELARKSGVSLGQVSNVRQLLEENLWIEASYGQTVLKEPLKLLQDWAENYRPERRERKFFTLDPVAKLEKRIADTVPNYAFTEFSAAEQYAPYTRHQRVAFYVPHLSDQHVRELDLKPGDGGSNVTVYETGEPSRFTIHINQFHCASTIQTYLDLRQLPGRGQDAAQHLLEQTLLPRWNL